MGVDNWKQLRLAYTAVPTLKPPGGSFVYDSPGIFGESYVDPPRSFPLWLKKLCVRCCHEKGQIYNVSGYLPHQSWKASWEFVEPEEVQAGLFSVMGVAGQDDDSCTLDVETSVEVDLRRRSLRILVEGAGRASLFVRQHANLLIGASEIDGELFLSELWCLNVEVPESDRPRPW